jgi:hypothetical protein
VTDPIAVEPATQSTTDAMPSHADEVRLRFNHVIALLAPTARGSGPVDWRDLWLSATLALHELDSVLTLIRRQLP